MKLYSIVKKFFEFFYFNFLNSVFVSQTSFIILFSTCSRWKSIIISTTHKSSFLANNSVFQYAYKFSYQITSAKNHSQSFFTVYFIDFNTQTSILIESKELADFQKKIFKLLYKRL